MHHDNVFHAGEIAVQERTGERAIAERHAPMIRGQLTSGARGFVERQSVVAVGAEDRDGRLWASLWCGDPGFVRIDTLGQHVELNWPVEDTASGDPVRAIVRSGDHFAMLAIDLAKRARLRINGVILDARPTGLELAVRETFGNCVMYIQRRERIAATHDHVPESIVRGTTIDAECRDVAGRIDTLFVASVHRERGLDVSHRGGNPGFVRVVNERTLRIPDYRGNSLFQTLGNFETDPRAGLALVDFDRGRVLSLTGVAASEFGSEDPGHPTGGTGRYWSFTVDRWVSFALPSAMRWTLAERSPFNP